MKRSLVLLLAPVLIGGCQNSPQAIDPFLPRTTVPPPATGSAVGAPAPYYPGPASGAAPAASGNFYTPPGNSYNYPSGGSPAVAPPSGPPAPRATDNWPMTRRDDANKQSSTSTLRNRAPASIRSHVLAADQPRDSEVKLASAELAAPPAQQAKPSNQVKIVRVVEPAAQNDESTASRVASRATEPDRLPQSDDAIDIMDLPPAHPSAERASRHIILASHEAPVPSESPAQTQKAIFATPDEAGRYAYAADYRWLKGQLEYSLVDQRWKLRYIPIDGATDSHGGSVVLDGAMPAEFQAGDFVTLRGSLAGEAAAGQFAPNYRFDAIEPLAE